MSRFKCQNCGAKFSVSDLCVTKQSDYICYACASRGVTMMLVEKAKELTESAEPPRIIHVTNGFCTEYNQAR